MRRLRRLPGFLAPLLLALVAFASPLHAQPTSSKPVTLAAIIESMEAREKLTDSVMLRWTQNARYRAGALLADPTEFTFSCEMLLKGTSMRYVGKTFSHDGGGAVTLIDHVSSYDGNESRLLQGTKPPRGAILQEDANTDAQLYSLMPFRLYFRPLAKPYATLKGKSLKLLDERKTIDGHECVTVDYGYLRVDLDRDRDFIPVAFQTYGRNHIVRFECTIDYYRNQTGCAGFPKHSS
jgi:hypothetical protein